MNNLERMKKFHQAKWNEPIIYELSEPGERAVLVPGPCCGCVSTDEALATLPAGMVRKERANLPEIAQLQLVRHYNHLSQENIGVDGNIDIGQGTCTMKYNPKINDRLAGQPKVADMHPLQPDETAQGILEVFYKTGELFKEISGLDVFSMQPGGGSHGVLALASIVRAYWRDKGEVEKRDEIITTLFSHPADCAVPIVKGYKVTIIQPDEEGYPDLEAFKAALSDRTAAIFFTNPEDTGIFNVRIKEFTRLAHEKASSAATTRPTPTACSASRARPRRTSTCPSSTCIRPSALRTAAAAPRREWSRRAGSCAPTCQCRSSNTRPRRATTSTSTFRSPAER